LEPTTHGWRLIDLNSKNGSFVDGRRVYDAELDRFAWLRLGDVHCEFVPCTPEALARLEQRTVERRQTSTVLAQELERFDALPELLQATLDSVCNLAECDRGFLLLCESSGIRLRAQLDIETAIITGHGFAGSVGAVERVLEAGSAIVMNDVAQDAELASRASVIAGGIRTLVCLPLRFDDAILGVVYADSRKPGAAITDLDLALLEAFSERAALWIAARRGAEQLGSIDAPPLWREIVKRRPGGA
jgi:GAF domain-containing protein